MFLCCTIHGTIAGWNPTVAVAPGAAPPSTQAVTVVKTTDGSSYTGLTSAFINGKQYLYATNFTKGRVDDYDSTFHLVSQSKNQSGDDSFNTQFPQHSFVADSLQQDYIPFNVHAIGNDMVVT